MQTRSSSRLVSNPSSNPTPSTNPNPKGRNRRRSKTRIEDFNLEELSPPVVTMADQRTMAQFLQAPTEGYEDANVVPAITADNFELKHGLLTLSQNKQFFGHDKEDPHAHVRYFNKITSTLKFPNVLNTSIKLTLFPFSLEDQDSLNFAVGGNFLDKMPRECLAIIESKSKVRYSRNKLVVAKVSTNTSTSDISTDVAELIDMVKALLLDKKNQSPTPVKAVEESCVTCGGMAECLALADLGASINLMLFSVWKRLSLSDLTPTCMTLELADRSISRPIGVAEDVYVKVGSFHFPANFVVVDFDADHRVPLILRRSFLKTERALIDVFEGELTLPVGKDAITFNLDQTSRYSANYSDMTTKRIDVIDMACEEYSHEVLGFSDTISSGNPTPFYDPIVSTTSPTLTPFENSDFLLEEVDAFLAIEDEPISPKFYQPYLDPEGDILLLEAFLNNDPSLPSPNQGNYMPEVRKELNIYEAKSDKSSVDEPTMVKLKDLPPHLEYAFLEGDDKLPLSDIKGIDPEFYTHNILMEEDFELVVQHQRRVNPKIHDVIKPEVIKLLKAGLIYPISDSPWVSSVHCVPKKGWFTVMENEGNELIPTRLVMGWHVCIDYHKLNEATRKDHFPLPFMDQMLERLAGNQYYCFLDDFSGYFKILIDPKDQEKITFTCPYGTFAYRRMPFRLCNAPGTNSFQSCLSHSERMLKRCEDTNLCLNWEKIHFMVKEGIVLGHKISKQGIEVDKAKVDVITKLPHPTTVKGIRSFLGHAGFYRHFIKYFSKIARPMTRLLEKDTPFNFSKECVEAFQTLKRKLTEAPILISHDWDMPFELMCNASDFAIRAVLGQRQDKHFRPIHYASRTMTEAESNYTTTEKEMLAVVYAFEKFRSYLIMNKSIMYTDHFTLKYLFAKKDSKERLLRWVLLLYEFTFKVIDTKGAENMAVDHLPD
nr:reverse transcriptase domain-containing protein [Tanacetum cinerariifolium]